MSNVISDGEDMNEIDISKIHTTPMGEMRIKRNLSLQTEDVDAWCRKTLKKADLMICQGKNWYAYNNGIAITINAKSLTVITAHKIKGKVRTMVQTDYPCLDEFLYQSIFIPQDVKPPSREIIYEPEIFVYISNFGKQTGDLGVVAEQNGQVIGAAWVRIISAYGHIDDDTPELAISIFPEFRGCGIGTKLMIRLFDLLRKNGYKQTSLSVQKDNPAVRFYKGLGYKIIGERLDYAEHEDFLMIKEL